VQTTQDLATRPLTVERGWQFGLAHDCPAGQHLRLDAGPQLVVPDGQPQSPLDESMHATPVAQHVPPHGVVPDGQQQPDDGSVHVPVQHVVPHKTWPAGHEASPLSGLRTVATAAPATAPPSIFNTPRRLGARAISRDRSSNSLMAPPDRGLSAGVLAGTGLVKTFLDARPVLSSARQPP
jgi:hypothetical protein